MLNGAKAEIQDGTTLTVKLPLVQLGAIIMSAGFVLGGVWLTTRDLRNAVDRLDATISRMSAEFDEAERERRANEKAMLNNDARIRVLEKCAEGCK